MKIAIDGPAGAGKSTVAKRLAEILGITYIDTGAMYRALTLKGLRNGIDFNDGLGLKALAENTSISFSQKGGEIRVYCDGKDVTEDIRSPMVSQWVSTVASDEGVREVMVRKQREMAENSSVVMDGRDITHTVLPDADFKFFLTASLKQRAKRRQKELAEKGFRVDIQELVKEIEARDKKDMQRKVGALRLTPDAVLIDTTNLDIENVLAMMLKIIRGD